MAEKSVKITEKRRRNKKGLKLKENWYKIVEKVEKLKKWRK